MADAAQTIATIISSTGGAALLIGIGRFIWKWRTGRISAERIRNTSIVMDRVKAIEERKLAELERDAADVKRRKIAEDNGRLRVLLIENGIDPGEEIDVGPTQTTAPHQARTKKRATKPRTEE